MAVAWSQAWQRREPRPLLIIDSARAVNFRDVPHVALHELARAVWTERRPVVAFHPRGEEEAAAALEAAHDAQGVHLLIDESAFWIDSTRGRGGVVERIARSARHYGMTLALTTQYAAADVSPQIRVVRPEVYVFRAVEPLALDAIEKRYALPREQVARLRDGYAFYGR